MDLHDILNLAGSTNDFRQKLSLARLYATLITGHSDKVYDAIPLENLLVDHFSKLTLDLCLPSKLATKEILHIITEPYNTGGHTRLCEKLAAMEPEDSQLLITRSSDEVALKRLGGFFKFIDTSLNEDELERIKDIFLKVLVYKKIILHIHPDDILTVIAVGLAKMSSKDLTVYFVNHADHVFSFGKSIADKMFQISYRGYETEAFIANKAYVNTFLGIPVDIEIKPVFKPLIKNIVIAGASFKMKPTLKISIQKQLFLFLKEKKNVNLKVIGCNYSDYWWWALKARFPMRVALYRSLPYDKYIELINTCDSCIDTAPVTGGTAFVELYLNSLRPIAIKSGIYGYTPLDKIRLTSLIDFSEYKDNDLDELFEDVKRVHGVEAVKTRYLDGLHGKIHEVDYSLSSIPNDMELFDRKSKTRLSIQNYNDLKRLTAISNFQKLNLLITNFFLFEASLRFILIIKRKCF